MKLCKTGKIYDVLSTPVPLHNKRYVILARLTAVAKLQCVSAPWTSVFMFVAVDMTCVCHLLAEDWRKAVGNENRRR